MEVAGEDVGIRVAPMLDDLIDMKQKFLFLLIFVLGFIAFALPRQILAFCPVCVVTTGTGVGLFRWLGVDDTIIGLWIGGFVISISVWLSKKIKLQPLMIIIGFHSLSLLLFNQMGMLAHPLNKLWGVNKLILGIIFGSLILISTPCLDKFLRSKNDGKIFVSHQKVIIPISLLSVLSLIFYFVTK